MLHICLRASRRLNGYVRLSDFDFDLPPEQIAQAPLPRRDASRLLVLERSRGAIFHRRFPDLLHYLRAGDVLVLNNSKVIPARLRGMNRQTGGQFEILLLTENERNDWWAMLRPGKRARPNTRIDLQTRSKTAAGISALVLDKNAEGHRRLRFEGAPDIRAALETLGEVPLPPYIKRDSGADFEADFERYQTVYAKSAGSVAAPTAGLHFTRPLLDAVWAQGVEVCFVTLHVGLGTFAPVKSDDPARHVMHEETFELPAATAQAIQRAKNSGGRVVAVGTTSVRVLESASLTQAPLVAFKKAQTGRTKLFIYPPYRFRAADALVTNFHLPRSTLLMLVSAFASPGDTLGRDKVLEAYAAAVRERYRFFSYGDAMLIT